jgi:DNA-binding CsgD family transcriptional regulator
VVIQGPAGIGKTELLAVLAERAEERRFVVLRARGSELESSMAFGAARQLFERALQSGSPARQHRLLAGAAEVGARAIGAGGAEAPADRFAALHGLFWLCANLAEREPVFLGIDDVQWVDEQSLAWLGFLGRRCAELRVLVAATLREGEQRGDRAELIGALTADAIEHVVLPPLSAESVAVLVRAGLGGSAGAEFCGECHQLTGGNPFLLRELVAAAQAEGLSGAAGEVEAVRSIVPAAVGTSVLARLTQMGQPAIALARALAVLGDGAEVAAAAELAGLDLETGELAADALASVQILAPGRPLEFFHPLIAAAVYHDLAPGARRLAHRRAAPLVARDGSASRVAAHLLATGPAGDEWVVGRLIDAAGEASDHGAPDAAASYLRRALGEPPAAADRPRLLLMLGEAEWRSRQTGAIGHLREALDAAADASTSMAAASALGFAYVIAAQAPLAVQTLEGALQAAADDPELALGLEGAIAAVGQWDERTAAAAGPRAEALLRRIDQLPHLPIGVAAALAFHAAKSNRSASEVDRLVERALAVTAEPPPQDFANALLATLWLTESYERALKLCDAEAALARRRGDVADLAEVSIYRSWVLLRQGELADAEAHARWALERGEASVRLAASASLIEALIERDALAAAEEAAEACTELLASPFITALQCLYARGRLRAAQGRLDEALADLLECGGRCQRLELRCVSGTPWRSEAAVIEHALGRSEQALRLVDEELELARAFGRPRALGMALRARALIDDGGDSLHALREAVALLSTSPARLDHARALTDCGTVLRRRGARSEARQQLARGLDLAHVCGARAIATRARGELIALGARPRRDAMTGRDALTASELRVARLAAQGMTNREIAQALYISAKTAEVHLSHTYRKLGISSRSELTSALAGLITAGRDAGEAAASVIS